MFASEQLTTTAKIRWCLRCSRFYGSIVQSSRPFTLFKPNMHFERSVVYLMDRCSSEWILDTLSARNVNSDRRCNRPFHFLYNLLLVMAPPKAGKGLLGKLAARTADSARLNIRETRRWEGPSPLKNIQQGHQFMENFCAPFLSSSISWASSLISSTTLPALSWRLLFYPLFAMPGCIQRKGETWTWIPFIALSFVSIYLQLQEVGYPEKPSISAVSERRTHSRA